MKMKDIIHCYILGFISLSLTLGQQASGQERRFEERSQIGVVSGFNTPIYKAGDESFPIFPMVGLNFGDTYLRGITLGHRVYKGWPFVDIIAQPSFQRLKPQENTITESLEYRHATAQAGVLITMPTGLGMSRLSFTHDILSRHSSWISTWSHIKFFRMNNWLTIAPGLQASYYHRGFVNYYFGVTETEATANLEQYSTRGSFEYGPSLLVPIRLGERFIFSVRGSYTWLGKEITRSPLVERNSRTIVFGSISYNL